MTRILIVGAGGFGREVYAWLRDMSASDPAVEIAGFLDDNLQALATYNSPVPVLDTIAAYQPQPDDRLVLALGHPRTKMAVAQQLTGRGAVFTSLVHPSAVVGNNVTMGRGCVLGPHATVTCDVALGDFVTVNLQATIGHDARVGDGCTLSCHADVTGFVTLGEGVLLGSHASVLPGLTVGAHAVVGAGSVVVKRVKPGVTVFGVPAKPI